MAKTAKEVLVAVVAHEEQIPGVKGSHCGTGCQVSIGRCGGERRQEQVG